MSHFHNTIEPNASVTPLEYYKETQDLTITATSDQSMQEDRQSGFVILFGHGYFIHAGNHGLVLPISVKRMKLYVNVGIVNTLVLCFVEHFLCI